MAAARGTEFIGTALLEEVRGNYERRMLEINEKLGELRSSSNSVAARHAVWRADAEARVSDLFRRINEATDAELSRFKIPSPPEPDDFKWTIQSLEAEGDRLVKARDKALAYIKALAVGPDGVVTLYAADLRRIGYGL